VPDGRGEQQVLELYWMRRLHPYAGVVLPIACCCSAVLEDLTPSGWTVSTPPERPWRASWDPKRRPETRKTVTAGPPPGYLLRITYDHRTSRCSATHRIRGEQLSELFIERARAGGRRISPWSR